MIYIMIMRPGACLPSTISQAQSTKAVRPATGIGRLKILAQETIHPFENDDEGLSFYVSHPRLTNNSLHPQKPILLCRRRRP